MLFWIILLATVTLGVLTLIPLSKNEKWWVRGLDFPRLQLAVLTLATLAVTTIGLPLANISTWLFLLTLTAIAIYHLKWIWPYTKLFPQEVPVYEQSPQAESIRLLAVNVLTPNENKQGLLEIISEKRPDVVVAVETDQKWENALNTLLPNLPHTVKHPLDNLYGMHLYSRFPLRDAKVQFLIEDDVPSIHTLLVLNSGQSVALHCIHPAPPSPTENEESTERDAELVIVAKAVRKEKNIPVIVTGDLNDVAWSATTRIFRKISGLLDPRIGRGIFSTFHAKIPFLRWPLDHLFVSNHFQLVSLERLKAFGSDHFPIFAELALPPVQDKPARGISPDAEDKEMAEEKANSEGANAEDVHTPGK